MLKLLQLILIGHAHKWKEVSRSRMGQYDPHLRKEVAVGDRMEYVCRTCGKRKIEDMF